MSFKLSFLSVLAIAQQDAVILQHITAKNGLTGNGTYGLLKDKRGLLWIATSEGLNRFDGKQIKTFRYNPQDEKSLCNNWVTALANDKEGNIWVGTRNGVCVIDPFSLLITRIKTENPIDVDEVLLVNNFAADPRGNVLVSTSRGLFQTEHFLLKERVITVEKDQLKHFAVRQVAFDSQGNLFLAADNRMLIQPAGNKNAEVYDLAGEVSNKTPVSINAFFITPDGNAWISTFADGLFHLSTAQKKIKKIPEPGSFSSFSNTGNNLFFLAANTKGIYLLDASLERITPFASATLFVQQQDKAGVNVVLYDKADGLWIGTGKGIFLLDVKKNDIRFISFAPILEGIEKKEVINAACIAKKPSLLFVSMIDSGYFFYDIYENKKLPVPAELLPWLLPSSQIEKVYQTEDGQVLFISSDAGIVEWDPLRNKATNWNKKYNSNAFSNVFAVVNDERYIWVSGKKGIQRYDKRTAEIVTIKARDSHQAASSYTFHLLRQDKKGIIWCLPVPVKNKKPCVGRIVPGSTEIRLFEYDAKDTSSLPAYEMLSDIEIDNNDMVWCASANGLISWASVTGKPIFRRYTVEDGLSSGRIYTVLADNTGKIWCGTAFGLSVYDPVKNFFSNYYREDGLSRDIVFYLQKGINSEIIVSSWAGIDIIAETGLQEQQPAGIPLISDLKINNTDYPLQPEQLNNNRPLRLSYRQNMVSIGFIWPDYRNPNNISYAYKLSGVDNDWVKTRTNTVSYANLREGKYVFEVKTLNSSELVSGKTTKLFFSISPPFWRTGWFIAAAVLVIICVGYYWFWLYISRIKERYRLRTIIAADLHDEIGSTLTSISILSNVSQQAFEKEPAKVKEMLQQIAVQSKTVQQNMSDIVWAIRPDNEKLENLLARMREYAAQTLEPLNIRTHININESLMEKVLSLEARKELLLIYKEAVNNIAKHSGSTEVNIMLQKKDQDLLLQISDNGRWKEKGNGSGTGFVSMQQRAVAAGGELKVTTTENGTTVTLLIPIT